ncbi:hypothetical protein AB0C96_20745 [Streptomyces sp. NPDC048506]|uniref:hypothetical protein n=1 Tax=Streptomyces sp. NPDC048506 TaxID=3155028 RepID=UPI00341C12ED
MTTPTSPAPSRGGSWTQTGPLTFNHILTADSVYEKISEVPALTIPYAGVWEIAYNAHTNFAITASGGLLLIHTALYNNAGIMPGSEAVTGIQTAAGFGFQATAGQTFLYTFAAPDTVMLYAYRNGATATAAISSGDDGRTGIMAHWVSPGF